MARYPSLCRGFCAMVSQVADFSDASGVQNALLSLENIDSVDVTRDTAVPTNDGSTPSTLALTYTITFSDDCLRGNVPDGALVPSCTRGTATDITDIACR